MTETIYYVYIITCIAPSFSCGKFYIGVSKDPYKRWAEGRGYIGNVQFNADIEKYGWKQFVKQILWSTTSKYDAAVMESFLIDKTNSSHSRIGYNQGMFSQISQHNEIGTAMYGCIPSSAYNEQRAWDLISDLSKNDNLSLFLIEQEIVDKSFFDEFQP